MIVHPHPDLVNAYDPQYGIARLSDRREQITTVAIRLWNADHDYLQGVNRKLWDMNMDEGGAGEMLSPVRALRRSGPADGASRRVCR